MTAAVSSPARSTMSPLPNPQARPRPSARQETAAVPQNPTASQALESGTVRAMVAIEVQVSRAVETAQGETTESYAFSVKAEADLFDAPVQSTAEGEEAGPTSAIDRLRAQFTPEKTAGRILDFALSGFARSQILADQGDTEGGRQAWANLMTDAIDQGFREARALFGELPEQTEGELAETAKQIESGLQAFVRLGLDAKKAAPGGTYDRARDARFSTRVELQASARRTVYDLRGAATAADATSQSRLLAVA